MAQAKIKGGPAPRAQTKVYGNLQIYGNAVLNPTAALTRIFVVFPPSTNSHQHDDFRSYVMTQPSIEGVTVKVPWNAVETTSPNQTDCTANAPDVCQADTIATGWFHTYDWSPMDGTGCLNFTANATAQWFCDFPNGTDTGYKKVGFQLFGIGDSPSNGITPDYVTSPGWISAAGASTQHVVNTVNTGGCDAYTGDNTDVYRIPDGTLFETDGSNPSTFTVHWTAHPFHGGETVWVGGFSNAAFNYTGATAGGSGTTVQYNDANTFKYVGSGQAVVSTNGGHDQTIVTSVQSWPVPFDPPYKGAWLSFLRAAIYHLNHLNNVQSHTSPDWNLHQTTGQIAYVRPGIAQGRRSDSDLHDQRPDGRCRLQSNKLGKLVWHGERYGSGLRPAHADHVVA